MLEALGRLGRGPQKADLLAVLHQHAPTWLVQLPALLSPAELEAVHRRVQGATRERMLREITEAVDALSTEHPFVFVLEDLHWSDPSTVELLATIARRREPARLLVIGTYRAAELVVTNHPLKTVKHELVARGQGVEVALDLLSPGAVRKYVSVRLAAAETTEALAEVVYRRTDGLPLFMVQVTDYLTPRDGRTSQALIDVTAAERALPRGLRELVEAQLERLTEDEQSVMDVGSVEGAEFTVASVAAGVAKTELEIEETCDRLVRRGQFLEERGVKTWPEGTASGSYGFRHALYQEVLYARIPEARRMRLHQAIGERIEAGYGARAQEVAAELTMHFERGRDYQRAVQYYQQASEKALQRHAYQETIRHVTKGLTLLHHLPGSPERAQQELLFYMAHGAALLSTKGFGAPEVEETYSRAHLLSQQIEVTTLLVPVLCGLWNFYLTRANFRQAQELAEQMVALAQEQPEAVVQLQAHNTRGQTHLFMGELTAVQTHIAASLRLYDLSAHRHLAIVYGEDPGVACYMYAALAHWLLGYPAQAARHVDEGMRLAQEVGSPFGVAQMLWSAAVVAQGERDLRRVDDHTHALITLCRDEGIEIWLAGGSILQGWVRAHQGQGEEGISLIQQGVNELRAGGCELARPHTLALLAEAYGSAGQPKEGVHVLHEALTIVGTTDERWYEAELWRLKGELTLQKGTRGWRLGAGREEDQPLASSL